MRAESGVVKKVPGPLFSTFPTGIHLSRAIPVSEEFAGARRLLYGEFETTPIPLGSFGLSGTDDR